MRLSVVVVSVVALQVGGCLSFAPVVEEPLRVGNVADPSPETLGFQRGVTPFEDAASNFAMRGATGVVTAEYAPGPGERIGVLTADYQSRVHVFRNGVYDRSFSLPTAGIPPYGMAARIVRDGAVFRLFVIVRDPLDREALPAVLLSYAWHTDHFELSSRSSLGDLASRHAGLTRPAIIGDDLSDGVLLVARDAGGSIWDTGYFLRMTDGRLWLEPQPMMDALRCSCVQKYALGVLSE